MTDKLTTGPAHDVLRASDDLARAALEQEGAMIEARQPLDGLRMPSVTACVMAYAVQAALDTDHPWTMDEFLAIVVDVSALDDDDLEALRRPTPMRTT